MKLCGFETGLNQPLFLIAGPCVIESRQMAIDTAGVLTEMTKRLGIPFIYNLLHSSDIIEDMLNEKKIGLIGGVYDISTGHVNFLEDTLKL